MPHKFAFTKAALAAALEETPISYEDLADIERDFDDAETEISESVPQASLSNRSHFVSQLQTSSIHNYSAKNTKPIN